MGPRLRAHLLDDCRRRLEELDERWVGQCLQAKGLEPGTPAAGEEWFTLGVVFRALRHYRRSLEEIAERGRPRLPGSVREGPDGRRVVDVFPRGRPEGLLFHGVSARSWIRDLGPDRELEDHLASAYGSGGESGPSPLCLVLGAGNVASLPVTDALTKLVVEDRSVLLKMSPVNAYLAPLIRRAFAPLVEAGALRVVEGGVEVGERLCLDDRVDQIHLTGSDRTYEAVVFGPGPEGRERKARGERRLEKPVTAELGNVTPVIVVPGPWSEEELRYHGEQLASWLATNAGFNCLTPRVLVQHRVWDRRSRLRTALEESLERIPTRRAYYPGAADRHRRFTGGRDEVVCIGDATGDRLPWTLIPELDPMEDAGDPCFREEAFCGLMCETALEGEDPAAFLERAVDFVNEGLWGTLVATILVHPDSLADPAVADALDRAVRDLRYGTVCVNARGEYGYLLSTTSWGGYPGSPPEDIQSGTGRVNNALMLPDVEKNVIRAPFRRRRDPFLHSSGVLAEFGRKYARWEAAPGPIRTASLVWTAIRARS